MNGHCSTCPIEKDCGYEFKPCDCRDQLKFKPIPQPVQKRPQNCGTSYCSCIECVMESAPVQDTEAHYKGVVEGVQKLFDDKRSQSAPMREKRDERTH